MKEMMLQKWLYENIYLSLAQKILSKITQEIYSPMTRPYNVWKIQPENY